MKTTESGGPRGYDGAKQVVGRRRHIAVDVEGSPIVVDVHAASVQDRDGAPAVIVALLEVAVCVEKLFADSGYAGPKLQDALKELGVSELIENCAQAQGRQGIYGPVTSLGSGANLRVDGALPSSCQGRREDCGKFSGLGEAGRMPVHDATGRSAPETTYVFGNRRLMTYGTDSKTTDMAKRFWSPFTSEWLLQVIPSTASRSTTSKIFGFNDSDNRRAQLSAKMA